MGDPTGTQGLVKGAAPSDVQIAFEGGGDFTARLKTLAEKKDEATAALSALKLGNDVKSMLTEAKVQLSLAQKDRTNAGFVVADAQRKAETLVNEAQAAADKLIAEAKAQAAQVGNDAQQARAAADAYAGSVRKAVDELMAGAVAEKQKAEQLTVQVRSNATDHADAAAVARKAAADAAAVKVDYEKRIAKIKALMAELGG